LTKISTIVFKNLTALNERINANDYFSSVLYGIPNRQIAQFYEISL